MDLSQIGISSSLTASSQGTRRVRSRGLRPSLSTKLLLHCGTGGPQAGYVHSERAPDALGDLAVSINVYIPTWPVNSELVAPELPPARNSSYRFHPKLRPRCLIQNCYTATPDWRSSWLGSHPRTTPHSRHTTPREHLRDAPGAVLAANPFPQGGSGTSCERLLGFDLCFLISVRCGFAKGLPFVYARDARLVLYVQWFKGEQLVCASGRLRLCLR